MTTECIVLWDIAQNNPDEKCTFGELFIEIDHRMICLIYFKITLIEGWVPERDHGTYINLSDIAQNDPNRGMGLWRAIPWNRPWNKRLDIAQNDPNRGIGLWGTLPWNRPWNKN